MTEQVPDAYAVTSGFLQAGVMTATTEAPHVPSATSAPSADKKRHWKGKKRSPSSTSAQASSYTPVAVP